MLLAIGIPTLKNQEPEHDKQLSDSLTNDHMLAGDNLPTFAITDLKN
ncbi:MAG TPA: hypothetical protein VKZ78_03685 [Sphingobacteriaceae bacterium]|nr:hypothetical protein [Sphingobacteriaceae bacterium]